MTSPSQIAEIAGPKALGFTGTQHRNQVAQLDTLYGVLIGFREAGSVWMHNGDCINSDEKAGDFWRTMGGLIHLHPPDIDAKRAFLRYEECSPPKCYLNRNRDIVNACDVLIATPFEFEEQARGGTWSTVRYARLTGTPIMFIWPDGRHTIEHSAHMEASDNDRG